MEAEAGVFCEGHHLLGFDTLFKGWAVLGLDAVPFEDATPGGGLEGCRGGFQECIPVVGIVDHVGEEHSIKGAGGETEVNPVGLDGLYVAEGHGIDATLEGLQHLVVHVNGEEAAMGQILGEG